AIQQHMRVRINQSRQTSLVREVDDLRGSRNCRRNRANLVAYDLEEDILSRLVRFAVNESSAMDETGHGDPRLFRNTERGKKQSGGQRDENADHLLSCIRTTRRAPTFVVSIKDASLCSVQSRAGEFFARPSSK